MNKKVLTVDYGMGNLWSVQNALRYLGSEPVLSSDPEKIRSADFLILPGVGSFRRAIEVLRKTGMEEAILEAVKSGAKILGICLGMQLLGASSTEDGFTEGLRLVPLPVEKFSPEELDGNKIPHIGFNTVSFSRRAGLFNRLPEAADFYFVHSFRMTAPGTFNGMTGTCNYGGTPFLAAFQKENIYGTQFHPEKSQTNGLLLLRYFLEN